MHPVRKTLAALILLTVSSTVLAGPITAREQTNCTISGNEYPDPANTLLDLKAGRASTPAGMKESDYAIHLAECVSRLSGDKHEKVESAKVDDDDDDEPGKKEEDRKMDDYWNGLHRDFQREMLERKHEVKHHDDDLAAHTGPKSERVITDTHTQKVGTFHEVAGGTNDRFEKEHRDNRRVDAVKPKQADSNAKGRKVEQNPNKVKAH